MLDLFCIWIASPKSPTFISYISAFPAHQVLRGLSVHTSPLAAMSSCQYLLHKCILSLMTWKVTWGKTSGKILLILVTAGERPKHGRFQNTSNLLCIFPTPYSLTSNYLYQIFYYEQEYPSYRICSGVSWAAFWSCGWQDSHRAVRGFPGTHFCT